MANWLKLIRTAEQLRLGYNETNYTSFTTGSTGDLTIAPTGGDTSVTGRLAASGRVTIGSAHSARGLSVALASTEITPTAGGGAAGIAQLCTFPSGVTSSGTGISSQVITEAASFTMASATAFYAADPLKGTGSAITTAYGLYVENITAGGTNYAIYTVGGRVRLGGLPTSATGLAAGTLWSDVGTLKVA
jgi:hypothetical protein